MHLMQEDGYAHAFDVAPYIRGVGIPWEDEHLFGFLAGIILTTAQESDIEIEWGGLWGEDKLDLGHFQIKGE